MTKKVTMTATGERVEWISQGMQLRPECLTYLNREAVLRGIRQRDVIDEIIRKEMAGYEGLSVQSLTELMPDYGVRFIRLLRSGGGAAQAARLLVAAIEEASGGTRSSAQHNQYFDEETDNGRTPGGDIDHDLEAVAEANRHLSGKLASLGGKLTRLYRDARDADAGPAQSDGGNRPRRRGDGKTTTKRAG